MKRAKRILVVAAGALAAGCNSAPANNSQALAIGNTPEGPYVEVLTAQPWNCYAASTFHTDGTMTAGDETWAWSTAGDRLILRGPTGKDESYRLSRRGADLIMTAESGSAMTLSPCPQPQAR